MKIIHLTALCLITSSVLAQGNGITKPSTGRTDSATTTEHIYFPTERQEERMEEVERKDVQKESPLKMENNNRMNKKIKEKGDTGY